MADWQIEKPLEHCWATDRKIEPGEDYYAALVETDNGFERRDFCSEYWEASGPEVYCYWKTRLSEPNEKKNIFIDNEMLLAFFERLEGESDIQKIEFRFVITLILMRKRKLKYISSVIEGERELWTLKVVGQGTEARVENPHLQEDRIEHLTDQLGDILQADL
ncbi:MAG: hypothetical protein ISS77_04155 [Phycisphaerae bacterium]|nr:hypothetical protein [Phycisphaerae bacterium]